VVVVGMIGATWRGDGGEGPAKNLANESDHVRDNWGFARRNKAELACCTQFWSANFLATGLVFDQTRATSCGLARRRCP
jgi:hypothetical protein